MIRSHDLDMIYLSGPGHGAPGVLAPTYLDGSYSEIYPDKSTDAAGMQRFLKQFSFPGHIGSHCTPETPGSIHEGGELGYVLSHACGAVFDNPSLIALACVGDGEAETGPLATSWHINKFLNPASDGAVLPVLHLNGYNIANPTLLARLPPGPPGACPPLAPLPEVAALTQPSEQNITFDSAQAQVLFGQPGVTRADPDYFALTVGNYVLGGGGFVSRLTNEVREKRGLTYSVYSYFAPGIHAGAFTVGLQTRSDQAAAALQVARDVVARFVAEGPTETELRAAKDNLVGGFALRIDTNRKLLDNVASIAAHRLPLDYLDGWTQQVEQVTVAQVRAAFERKLQPATMATVVLGATGPTAP